MATLLRRRGNVVTAAWQRCYGGVATLLWARGNVVMGPWQRCYGPVATDEARRRHENKVCRNDGTGKRDGAASADKIGTPADTQNLQNVTCEQTLASLSLPPNDTWNRNL